MKPNAFTKKPDTSWIKAASRDEIMRQRMQKQAQKPTPAQLAAFHTNFRHDKARIK